MRTSKNGSMLGGMVLLLALCGSSMAMAAEGAAASGPAEPGAEIGNGIAAACTDGDCTQAEVKPAAGAMAVQGSNPLPDLALATLLGIADDEPGC